MLEVSEREEGVVAIHLHTESLKTHSGWGRYRDANPVPLANDIPTAPSGSVQSLCL